MPNTKEKLIELLGGDMCKGCYCEDCEHENDEKACIEHIKAMMADHLIANGVTVQEMDGCEYCKEDNEGFRRMFGAFSITKPFNGGEWLITTGHCKPRQICFCPMCGRRLPQPPKGE